MKKVNMNNIKKYIFYFVVTSIVMWVIVAPVSRMMGEIHALEQQTKILYKIACTDLNGFKKMINQISITDNIISEPLKSNQALWGAVKIKMIEKCN